jgi:hypothetical protein
MTTIYEVPTKSKLGPCSWDAVLAPSDAQPSRHPRLPHCPSNKAPQSREVWFDEVVTRLLGLSGPMKPDIRPVQIKACHRGQNDAVLNQHGWGLPVGKKLKLETHIGDVCKCAHLRSKKMRCAHIIEERNWLGRG